MFTHAHAIRHWYHSGYHSGTKWKKKRKEGFFVANCFFITLIIPPLVKNGPFELVLGNCQNFDLLLLLIFFSFILLLNKLYWPVFFVTTETINVKCPFFYLLVDVCLFHLIIIIKFKRFKILLLLLLFFFAFIDWISPNYNNNLKVFKLIWLVNGKNVVAV